LRIGGGVNAMAVYMLRTQPISRGQGRSVVRCAAYRSGSKLYDHRTGLTHDFSRRKGVLHTEIIGPDNAPDWMLDRSQLWNAVETVETKSNSRLAREILLALPHELDHEQRLQLVRDFVSEQFVGRGMIADIAIHAPDEGGDQRNFHAHILLTCRELMGNDWHPDKATATAREWNTIKSLRGWREEWAAHQNRTFERMGLDVRVDHRTNEERDLYRQPTQHMGPAASAMERKGQKTRIGDENRATERHNAEIEALQRKALIIDIELERLKRLSPADLAKFTKEQGARHKRQWAELKDRNAKRKAEVSALRPQFKQIVAEIRDEYRPSWSELGKRQARDRREFYRNERTLLGTLENAFNAVSARGLQFGDKGFLKAVLNHLVDSGARKVALDAQHKWERERKGEIQRAFTDHRLATAKVEHAKQVEASKAAAKANFDSIKAQQDTERARVQLAWKAIEDAKAAKSAKPARTAPQPDRQGAQYERGEELAKTGRKRRRRVIKSAVQEKPVKNDFEKVKAQQEPAPKAPVDRVRVSQAAPQPIPFGAPPAPRTAAREVPKIDKAEAYAKTPEGRAVVERQTAKAAPDPARVNFRQAAAEQTAQPTGGKAKTDFSATKPTKPQDRKPYQRPSPSRDFDRER
jgi:hypothetical protein